MSHKIENPGARDAGASDTFSLLAENNSKHSAIAVEIQRRRAAWIARRHRLPVNRARVIAAIYFMEART